MRLPPARRGFTLLELVIVIAILGALAAIATPNFHHRPRRASQRACFANQKTIAGAIEMYNLDFNTAVTRLTPELAARLEKEGYLQLYPRDPGGEGEYRLSQLVENGIYCTKHGPIQGPFPDAWRALHEGILFDRLPGARPQDLTWLFDELRAQSASELRRARLEGAVAGGLTGFAIPSVAWMLWLIVGHLRRRDDSVAAAGAGPGLAGAVAEPGILRILSTRGLGRPWPPSRPGAEARCPVCAEGFREHEHGPGPEPAPGDAHGPWAESCPRCLAPHHRECREFNQGCGIYACGQT